MTHRNGWRRWAAVGVIGAAVGFSPLAGSAIAQRSAVPLSNVTLPAAVDWQAEYQGQVLCSPEAKPGATKLSALLAETYGKYTTYISRSCDTPGISEHEEGRAIDWMVDAEIPTQRTKAWQFLNWVTAPGPQGEPGAMARRLGIMYLIYEDKMWRVYRPQDGWTEYQGCSAKQDEGYDTSCHRDHIHMSLTWDGAYARTSFWTGAAETRAPCSSGTTTSRSNGSASDPVTLIDGNKGIGTEGSGCRLGAKAYSSRSYQVKVPVPEVADGATPVQQVQVHRAQLNAPVPMTLRSAATVSVAPGTKSGTVVAVPLAADGVITVTLGAGYGDVVLRGIGTGAGQERPAKVTLRPPTSGWVNTPMSVTGKAKRAPAGALVTVHRRSPGTEWTAVGQLPASADRYSLETPAVTAPGSHEFKAVLTDATGRVLDESNVRGVDVRPAEVTLQSPARTAVGRATRLRGAAMGVPADGQVQVLVRRDGQWRVVRQQAQPTSGSYVAKVRLGRSGTVAVRAALTGGGVVLDRSPKVVIRVGG